MIKELQSDVDFDQTTLFQVLFILQNAPSPSFQLQGLTAKPFLTAAPEAVPHRDLSTFDLIVEIEERQGGLSVIYRYNSDLYGKNSMNRLLNGFHRVLEIATSSPDLHISDIDVQPGSPRSRDKLERHSGLFT